MSRGWRRWQPWTVALLGAGVFGLTALDLAVSPGSPVSLLFEASVPMILSAGVVGFGLWLHATDFDGDELTRIAAWCGGSTVVIGLLGGWAFLVMRDAGVPTADASFVVLAAVAFGGAIGVVVSLYDAGQRRLRARAQRFRDALDASVDGIVTVDPDGRIDALNRSTADIMGYDDPDELVGESWRRLHPEDAAATLAETAIPSLRDAGSWRGEVTALRADGETFPTEMSLSLLDDGGTVAVVRDVAERNEREAELRYRTSLLSAQFEAGRDGILIVDGEWEVLACNDRFLEMWDLPEDAAEAEDLDLLSALGERLASPSALRERAEYLEANPFESDDATIQARDGRIFDRYSAPISDEDAYFGRVFTFRDVTEDHRRDRTIEALHQASHQLAYAETSESVGRIAVDVARKVFSKPVSGLWLLDGSGETLRPAVVSPAADERFREAGYDGPPALGGDSPEMAAIEGRTVRVVEAGDDDATRVFSGVDAGTVVLVQLADHGVLALGDPEAAGLSETEHQLVGILQQHVLAALDRVARQRVLTEREQRLRTIVENVPIVLFAFDGDGEMLLSEGQGLGEAGLSPGEVVGQSIETVFADDRAVLDVCREALTGEPTTGTVEFGGRTFEAWLDPVVEGDEVTQVIGTAVDVTDRVRYERAIESFHDATRAMMAADEPVEVCGEAVSAVREALGFPMAGIWLADDAGSRLRPVEVEWAGADALPDPSSFGAGDDRAWAAHETGETMAFDDVEGDDRHPRSEAIQSELVVPIGSSGVLVVGDPWSGSFDRKDRTLVELLAENTAAALARTERSAALRRRTAQFEFFNSILRHDVLNGMTVIRSRATFLAERLDGDEGRFARTIVEWSDDVVEVVGRVRRVLETLTSERESQLEPVDVGSLLEERVVQVGATYPDIEFDVDAPDDLRVVADELLSDVLGNVIKNAVEHNDADGLRVEATAVANEESVTLRIADNGSGVDDDRKESVFRRGETGHAKATGSGFGLFFVDAMVERYGGDAWVEDNGAGGATFAIRLPRVAGGGVE